MQVGQTQSDWMGSMEGSLYGPCMVANLGRLLEEVIAWICGLNGNGTWPRACLTDGCCWEPGRPTVVYRPLGLLTLETISYSYETLALPLRLRSYTDLWRNCCYEDINSELFPSNNPDGLGCVWF